MGRTGWIDRGLRLLLRLAPASFRDRWEREVGETVRQRCRAARENGRRSAALVGVAELVDLARAVARLRLGRRPPSVTRGPGRFARRRGKRMMPVLMVDVRHAYRRFRAKPGTSLAAIAMLAVAVGVATAMFTIVDALLLRPVPFAHADRLARLEMLGPTGGWMTVEPAVLRAWRESSVIERAEGVTRSIVVIEAGGRPLSVAAAGVSPGLFDMLGVRPLHGRLFEPAEGAPGVRDRVVMAERLWRGAFGGDPSIIGQRIQLDETSGVVVGIMPDSVRIPEANTQVWTPFDFETQAVGAVTRPAAYVRFAADVPETDALQVATAVARAADPRTRELEARRSPLIEGYSGGMYPRQAVPVLAGAVALVFLVLCANVVSLLLARFTGRQREFSMCAALGASRGRLLRQSFLEGGLLVGVGGVTGIAFAWSLVAAARRLVPASFALQTLNPLDLDGRAVMVALAASLVSVAVAAGLPAWIGTRPNRANLVSSRGSTETRSARLVTRALLIAEVALACTLLVGATLLVRTFVNLASVEIGFRTEGILTVSLFLDSGVMPDTEARAARVRLIDDVLLGLPGVERTAWSGGTPWNSGGIHWGDDWVSDLPGAAPRALEAESRYVDAHFFEMYDVRLLRGRAFQAGEDPQATIVGERMAEVLWPGVDPIGRSFTWGQDSYRVVGVAQETRSPVQDLERPWADWYLPFSPGRAAQSVGIQCSGECPSEGLLRQQLLSTGAGVTVHEVVPLDAAYREELAQPRAAARAIDANANPSAAAAAGGLFSVLSYGVSRRRREFGIRMALGSSPQGIGGLVLRDGLSAAAIGVGCGSVLAWGVARAMASLQYGVSASDSATWLVVLGVLSATTIAAASRPALEAMRTDPIPLLREE